MADQSNAGKHILITGVALGVVAIGLGIYSMVSLKPEQPLTDVSAKSAKADALAAEAVAVKEALLGNHDVVDIAPQGAEINGKPRFTPIFFAPELWQVAYDDKKKNVIMDVYDPTAPCIHKDVPNAWFIKNGIAEALGRSDGLEMDSDNDGFSNYEEYLARTNPADASSLPPLVQANKTPKLEVVKVEKASAVITVDSSLAVEATPPADAGIKIFARVGDTQPIHKATVKPGDPFGLAPGDKSERFTVIGFVKADFANSAGDMESEMCMKVRDNATVAGEKEFVIRPGRPRAGGKDQGTPNAKGRVINDTTVTLRVTAGPAAGKPEGTFKVPEKGSFTVPGSKGITCKLESVDAAGTVNVLPKGAESPVNVPKAAN